MIRPAPTSTECQGVGVVNYGFSGVRHAVAAGEPPNTELAGFGEGANVVVTRGPTSVAVRTQLRLFCQFLARQCEITAFALSLRASERWSARSMVTRTSAPSTDRIAAVN